MKFRQYLTLTLILALCSGIIFGCASKPKKKLKTKGFTLLFRDKASAKDKFLVGSSIKSIQLVHPLKISEPDVRSHLESLVFQELSLLGKKKPVFIPQDVDRIARIITKALHHVPREKIIHYKLETTSGVTEGDIFASKKHIHWRLISINGMAYSARAYTGWGNANWKMLPQLGQRYHTVKRVMGTGSQENWIVAKLVPSQIKYGQKNYRLYSGGKVSSKKREDVLPTKNLDPALEEKFQLLKELSEKNLINEDEYKQKRKELLDNYL